MTIDRAQALQEALVAAAKDGAVRAPAVNALRDSSVWAATWPTDPATLRTLTNSNGVTALAVFSDEAQLEEAAIRYAWLGVDGRVPSRHLHISEVVRFAKQNRAQLVVVDIAADHALELDEGDMEQLAALPSNRPPAHEPPAPAPSNRPRPYQGVAPVQSHRPPSGLQPSVRPHGATPGASKQEARPTGPAISQAMPTAASTTPGAPSTGTGSASHLLPPVSPSDALFDALSHVLRDYPEVEWGCLLHQARPGTEAAPCVALRIDPSFRKNVNEISVKLREASINHGQAYDVVVLDAPDQIKHARQAGRPFYPWRKK